MKEEIKRCFFCDNIIIPQTTVLAIEDIKEYFKKIKIPFTLNYNISRFSIGNKIICMKCETDLKKLIFSNNRFSNEE